MGGWAVPRTTPKMAPAEIMLAKHFLLNFTVVFLPPKNTKLNINAKDRNMMGQCRAMLHVDNLRKTLEMWMKGTCVLSFKLRAVNAFEVLEEEGESESSAFYRHLARFCWSLL